MSKPDVQPDEDPVSVHPLAPEEALEGLLATPPESGTREQQLESIAALFEWQIKNDPVATAAFDRTDGFIPAEEYAERLRQRRES